MEWILKKFTSKLWLRATMFCFAGIFTAFLGLIFRGFIPPDISRQIGAEAVYPILEIIASSMLAVTTFSLSIMVSAYSAATTNATPRATKLLLEDSISQTALSTFIGSFLFSIVGIIALHMGVYGNSGRIILFAVTIAVVFIIVATLLVWIEYLSRLGRMSQIINAVEKAASKAINYRLEHPYLGGNELKEYKPSDLHHPLILDTIGYIQHIDMSELHEISGENKTEIYLQVLPGSFNDSIKPLLYTSSLLDEEEYKKIKNAFTIGNERSFDEDPRYGLIVLSEIASRALSPAINDPGTAIDLIGSAIRVVVPWIKSERKSEEVKYPDIYVRPLSLADMLYDIFTPISRDGAGMIEVGIKLQKTFRIFYELGDGETKIQAKYFSELALKRALNGIGYRGRQAKA